MAIWAALGAQLASFTLEGTSHLVDVPLHTTREADFTDRAAACRVFIARPASQTLRQSTRGSGLDMGDAGLHARSVQGIRWFCVRFPHRIVCKQSVSASGPPQKPQNSEPCRAPM
jgi:hypothetical protein